MPAARSVLQETSCVLQTFPQAPLSGVTTGLQIPPHVLNEPQICTELTSF